LEDEARTPTVADGARSSSGLAVSGVSF